MFLDLAFLVILLANNAKMFISNSAYPDTFKTCMKLVFQTTFEGAHLSWLTLDVLDLATGADSDFEESATPAQIHKYKCYSADPCLQKDSISIFRYFHSITEAYESFFFLSWE